MHTSETTIYLHHCNPPLHYTLPLIVTIKNELNGNR